jgi:dipeptidyl-peptidase-4
VDVSAPSPAVGPIPGDEFPRLSARTGRFRFGAPRSARCLGPDGVRVAFLRSSGPEDPVHALWIGAIVADGAWNERLLADPRTLGDAEIPAAERARRERLRESAQGITDYTVDAAGAQVAFALDGAVWTVATAGGEPRRLETAQPVIDPRISPDGRLVAYSTGPELRVAAVDGSFDCALSPAETGGEDAGPEDAATEITWGLADFIAGEEMHRFHGLWWSPDSRTVLAQRTDPTPVPMWHISDPAHPERAPRCVRYPRALTANAEVRLFALPVAAGSPRVEIVWDREDFEYLAAVHWTAGGDPVIQVQSRDQQHDQVRSADPATGATALLTEHADPCWLELVGGVPASSPDGALITVETEDDTYRLARDGACFSPTGWQVRGVLDVGDQDILATASADPERIDVVRFGYDGTVEVLTPEPGVFTADRRGAGLVVTGSTMDVPNRTVVRVGGRERTIPSRAAAPAAPRVEFREIGPDRLRAALVRPRDSGRLDDDGTTATGRAPASLPVLIAPYGGPGAQQVLRSQRLFWEAQWWADQGFLVLVVDGHGAPGRGPAWDRTIRGDFSRTLDDQVTAVKALPELAPEADPGRVAIHGWSFGGYLSALAVLRRPDVFRAAVAGAPPTDWTLYDTHYTERYLGLDPEAYRRSSLIADAPRLRRPLLLVHGLADDNVAVAHTLRLSAALLRAGRPHAVLPLTGITHMTSDPDTAEHLLTAQLDFLTRAIAAAPDHATENGAA